MLFRSNQEHHPCTLFKDGVILTDGLYVRVMAEREMELIEGVEYFHRQHWRGLFSCVATAINLIGMGACSGNEFRLFIPGIGMPQVYINSIHCRTYEDHVIKFTGTGKLDDWEKYTGVKNNLT